MEHLIFPEDLKTLRGNWITTPDINVTDVCKRDIYRTPEEPSYVSWAILWKERSGALKLSFVEVAGDKTAWPPTYNFNSRDIEYYLKTLVSNDGGETWAELQVSHKGNLLKAADLCTSENWGATYTCFKDEAPGAVALFTNKSTGAFRNVRFSATPETIRTNWFRGGDEAARCIALDAGRGE